MGNGPKSKKRRAGKKRVKRTKRGDQKKMKHYIKMDPRKVRFVDEKGEEIDGDDGLMTWKKFFDKVQDHPKWGTTYKLGRYMTEILEDLKKAIEVRKDWVLEVADEAYKPRRRPPVPNPYGPR